MSNSVHIAVFPGDGIGLEIMDPCRAVIDAALRKCSGPVLSYETLAAGAGHYRETGTALPDDSIERAGRADTILLAAMGLPDVRYPDGTEIAPQIDIRKIFDLYAGLRPVRTIPGIPPRLSDPRAAEIDFVLVRESTEGLFVDHGKGRTGNAESETDRLTITRKGADRVSEASFRLAEQRSAKGYPGRVTLIDKANVLASMVFFREVFDDCARRHPDIIADHAYVDATALNLVARPWDFDVMVTENMYGDILSDLGAALIGGMGFAPSADIGDKHAVFQPCHGTAPDLAGRGLANPTAMFLSGAMMLEWLSERSGSQSMADAATLIRSAVDGVFGKDGLRTGEIGGNDGLRSVTNAVLARLA